VITSARNGRNTPESPRPTCWAGTGWEYCTRTTRSPPGNSGPTQ
jgi:hypothetical protein